ncbi:MAG: hypothetical protein JXB03_09985 [Spirochaetales bacterium]|nr:hypothetical protein [Spirochaetales bacterium]
MNLSALLVTAVLTGVLHTVAGPDHYVPFIALGRARNWSVAKTSAITLIAGSGHVLSSILIGFIGLGLSIQLDLLTAIESVRGDVAAWFFIAFGLAYMVWGISTMKARQSSPVTPKSNTLVGWILFIIFAFGPCEPLIPLFIYPAATIGIPAALLVSFVFLAGTLSTMLVMVLASTFGLKFLPVKLHGYAHPVAGSIILVCGLLIKLGL